MANPVVVIPGIGQSKVKSSDARAATSVHSKPLQA